MSCLWEINGTIKPKKDKMDQVTAILREYGLGFGYGIEEGTFDISCSSYGDPDDLADALSSMLDTGEIDATIDEYHEHIRYAFQNGEWSNSYGIEFTCYLGYEEDFAEQLPKDVANYITDKAFMEKRSKFVTHYQDLIRRYFADQTEEGRMDKHARMEEAEYTLIHCFGMTPEEIHAMYNALYTETYFFKK